MSKLEFKIPGVPVAKGRPRFVRGAGFTYAYTPKNTRTWERFVHYYSMRHRPSELWEGPIAMALTFMMPRPKSLPKKVVYHTKKPDLDNLAKSIKDALQGIIYKGDSQIIVLNLEKKYTLDEYGVAVKVEEVK